MGKGFRTLTLWDREGGGEGEGFSKTPPLLERGEEEGGFGRGGLESGEKEGFWEGRPWKGVRGGCFWEGGRLERKGRGWCKTPTFGLERAAKEAH